MRTTHSGDESSEPDDVPRLIDQGTLGLEASIAGLAERYERGKTTHTIHVWWARRPHAAMRALVFATLCPLNIDNGRQLVKELALATNINDPTIQSAQRVIEEAYETPPKVLDMFGGGGTIPYEIALLGGHAHSLDYNPLSVFLQKANLVFSQQAVRSLGQQEVSRLIENTGRGILQALKLRTYDLFPLRGTATDRESSHPFAYFWTYQKNCRQCGFVFHLSKRPWLSQKPGKRIALKFIESESHEEIGISKTENAEPFRSHWRGRAGIIECPRCHEQYKNPSIKECSDKLVAIGELRLPMGKEFSLPPTTAIPTVGYLAERERKLLETLKIELPTTSLPKWSGIVNPALYGIETYGEFLNQRQRLVLLELIILLRMCYGTLLKTRDEFSAKYIVALLSGLIDQLVDWNCRLSMWIAQNEQVGRALSGPGVPMLWDYVETDPLEKGPANLWDKVDRIVEGAKNLVEFKVTPEIQKGMAQSLPYADETFDAIVTDPPYYDNLYYNILADFFYSWKRMVFHDILPELFEEEQSSFDRELVASRFRQGDSEAAHAWYCQELTQALREACRVLKANGRMSFVYGHSSLKGWQAIVESFRNSGLVIENVEPLSIERRQRPRAMTSAAINTCIVFVARRRGDKVQIPLSVRALSERIEYEITTLGTQLKEYGWANKDAGMAIVPRAVALLANAAAGELPDLEALAASAEQIKRVFPEFQIQKRSSI